MPAILVIADEKLYLRILKSLGAAHWVAQCWRWKTGARHGQRRTQTAVWSERRIGLCYRTFFNTVFLASLELLGVFMLVGNALNALFIVVFVAGALRGSHTVCKESKRCQLMRPRSKWVTK